MRIAICDDCVQFRENIFKLISSNLKSPNNIIFVQFSSAEEILKAYKSGKRYDLIFLDVEMGMVNGIDAGIKIRQYDAKAIIIFVSSYPKYAIPAYDCEAFYFIVKPIDEQKFKKVLYKAIEKYKLLHQYYIIKNKGEVQKIAVKDILYVEIYRKHLIFHTTARNYETVGKISEALVELSPYGFCQVHQGYLANMNRIKEFIDYDIVMDNGEKVMISVRKKAEVLRRYADYLERTC